MCHKFIILANVLNDLLFGILTKSIESISSAESTLTPDGCIVVGLIILTCVGVPNSYLDILLFCEINTFIVVPLASTCCKLVYPDRSISSVNPVQF